MCGKDAPLGIRHACKFGLEGIVSKRKDSPYRSGRAPDWLKMKNPACAAVKREAEEDWGRREMTVPTSQDQGGV
jgi:bifunctional non-homologous end joining protein LigD